MSARRLVAALQRVGAAGDAAQLDAAIAAADRNGLSSILQQPAGRLAEQQLGAALAAALARCLRAVSANPAAAASAAAPARPALQKRPLEFAAALAEMLFNYHHELSSDGGRIRLLQDVCATGLPDVLPAACKWLTAQLTPPLCPQEALPVAVDTAVWHTASLATSVANVYTLLAGLAAKTQREDARNSAAAAALAKLPAADTFAAVGPLAVALLLWHQKQHDSLQAMAAASGSLSTRQERQRARVYQAAAKFAAASKPGHLLSGICYLVRCCTNGRALADAVIATAPQLPWLAAVCFACFAAARHTASGGAATATPLPPAASHSTSNSSASSSSSRPGHAGGSRRNSRPKARQGSQVPAHHTTLLATLGVASLEAAFPARVCRESNSVSSSVILGGYCVLYDWAPQLGCSSSSSTTGSSTQLSMGSVRLLRAVFVELAVLGTEPFEQLLCIRLFAQMCLLMGTYSTAREHDAGDAEALSLLLTLVLPAAQNAAAAAEAAAAADPGIGNQSTGNKKTYDLAQAAGQVAMVCALTCEMLPTGGGYSVFDSQLFQEHPAAVLRGLEAAARIQMSKMAAGEGQSGRPLAYELLQQAACSTGLCSWLQETVSAHAAGGSIAREAGSNCSRLLCLLMACTKGLPVFLQQQHAALALQDGCAQLASASLMLLASGLIGRLMDAAAAGAAACDSADGVPQQQLQLDGLGHLLGRSLVAAGSFLRAVPSAAAEPAPEPQGAAAAAAAASGGIASAAPAPQHSGFDRVWPEVVRILAWLQTHLPTLDTPGFSQQQLLEPLEALAAAAEAVAELWSSPAARAEAAASAEPGAAADAHSALLCLLRRNPAVVQQLSSALAAMGSALCAALLTKHACNDPACTCCDKASEQQLVSGKGSVCSGCRVARYCCLEHQHAHWRAHRPACKALAAAQAAAASGGGGGQASSSSGSKKKQGKAGGGSGSSSSRRDG